MNNIEYAKANRRNQTDAEKLLWRHLRNRQLSGFKFRRQVPIGPYIVDFVCMDAKLVIELDGSQHLIQQDYDHRRTEYLQMHGYRVLRCWNHQIFQELESVLGRIYEAL